MSYKIYKVTKNETVCEDYEVKINGKAVELNTARVSAVPFNRRWPGHQRGIEQSELINFVSLASNEKLKFEIKSKRPFNQLTVRPKCEYITPTVDENGVVSFEYDGNGYFTVEPYGRNNALHIFIDPIDEYNVDFSDPNTIYFGAGEHNVGFITLKSNQTLFLDEGAVVYACVRAKDAENIKILGRGILDNSKNKEKILFEANEENNDSAVKNVVREHTVQLEYCTNIEIDGITIRDSLVYNIRPVACKNIKISNIKIIGCWRYNSDGIDMHNCENVLIDNCFIRTFDDSICVKGFDCYYKGDVEKAVHDAMYRNGKSYDVFKNVSVKNCVIWNDWGKCLEIGAETRAEEICDVVFENCNIIHVNSSVLDCLNVDYADVHDITFKNIQVEYDDIIPASLLQKNDSEIYVNPDIDYSPNLLSSSVVFHHEYSAGGNRRGINRNITFENIYLFGRHKPKMLFEGFDESHKTKDITIKNLYLNGELIRSFNEVELYKNEFTENIKLIAED